MGSLSYSLYLLHGPVGERVVNLGSRYAHAPVAQVAVMFAAVAVSAGAAYALYRLVELPRPRDRRVPALRRQRARSDAVRDRLEDRRELRFVVPLRQDALPSVLPHRPRSIGIARGTTCSASAMLSASSGSQLRA